MREEVTVNPISGLSSPVVVVAAPVTVLGHLEEENV